MIGKFFEGLGGELGKRWAGAIAGPASLLLGLGIGAWAMGRDDGFKDISDYIGDRSDLEKFALAAAVVASVVLLAQTAKLLGTYVRRLLEGYWHFGLRTLADCRVASWHDKQKTARRTLTTAAGSPPADRKEAQEYAKAMIRLREIPSVGLETRPTAAGNILRAAEVRARTHYGLDAAVCWPHLWLCLPEHERKELADTHAAMATASVNIVWVLLSALLFAWSAWVWCGLFILGLAATATGLHWASQRFLEATRAFASLIDAAFSLHRADLYAALRWPPPASAAEEVATGERATAYLWSGLVSGEQPWTPPTDPGAGAQTPP